MDDDLIIKKALGPLWRLGVRTFVYALLLAGIAVGMMWGAVHVGPSFYDELGAVETAETVFAITTALIFLLAGRMDSRSEPCAVVVATLLFCAFVRESDYLLDEMVGRHAWKVIVTLILVLLVFYAMRNLHRIVDSVSHFVMQPSFGVFMSGVLVLIIFSRLFGYGPFWKELIEGSYYRVIKTIVEEGVELMGYFLILVSSCEYFHDARMARELGPGL